MTAKKDSCIEIRYRIIAIKPYKRMNGHLEVFLEPVDPLLGDVEKPETESHEFTFSGPPDPEKVIKMLVGELKGQAEEKRNDRGICLVIPQSLFDEKGWRYGAIIKGIFKRE